MEQRYRIARGHVRSVDLESATVTAVVSTETRARDGDVIQATAWDLANFEKHPVLISGHNYGSLQSQIGEWTDMRIDRKERELVGTAQYYLGSGNREAEAGFQLAKRGRAAYSVGFIPDFSTAVEMKDSTHPFGLTNYEFKRAELLEVSQVTIPADPNALQRIATLEQDPIVGTIIRELIEEQLKESPPLDAEPVVVSADAAQLRAYQEALKEVVDQVVDRLGHRLDSQMEILSDMLVERTTAVVGRIETTENGEKLPEAPTKAPTFETWLLESLKAR